MKPAIIALVLGIMAAPAAAFEMDIDVRKARTEIGSRTVGGLPTGKRGYVIPHVFCTADSKLYILENAEVGTRARLPTHLRIERLPKRKVGVVINYNLNEVKWSKNAMLRLYSLIVEGSKPCRTWLELYGLEPTNVLGVTTIDGHASLKRLLRMIRSPRTQ